MSEREIPQLLDGRLAGFDYSFYRTRIGDFQLDSRYKIFNGDAKRVALASGYADLAFTSHCLEHMRYDNRRALEEMARLAPMVLLIEPFLGHQNAFGRLHNFRSDYARDIYENVLSLGFEVIEYRPLHLGTPFNQSGLLLARSPRYEPESQER